MNEKTQNIIETIKTHKKTIIKGGLILLGTAAGITLVALAKKGLDNPDLVIEGDLILENPGTEF